MPNYIITNMRTIGIKNKSKIYIWGALALMLVVIACDYQKMNEKKMIFLPKTQINIK